MATTSCAVVVSRGGLETCAHKRNLSVCRAACPAASRGIRSSCRPQQPAQHMCKEKRSFGIAAGLPSTTYRPSRSTTSVVRCQSSTNGNASIAPWKIPVGKGPVVVIDNYDSFTYNLCQYLGSWGCDYVVFKNDEITVEEIRSMNPAGILMSPGPGAPEDSGIALQTIKELGPEFPLFGVCMGHQCIGQVFGGKIVRAPLGVMHGKTSQVTHLDKGILQGLSSPFTAARYHSLVIDRDTFPDDALEMTAWTDDGMCMAVQHRRYPHIQGVQFHPESCITEHGMDIVRNFLRIIDEGVVDLQATKATFAS
mmetsp:Transcript_7640/g.13157  ORF Transcript_7640/g.13157 Transcript_7640/m.13157 type:complete len:309 (-) Transcript_7640:81-1007(-)|eukprot:CAMPEP_0198228962 /NCGR_PEP_ID=MMETSP1445-20131203/113875_1 /TAXON_ID=36898 /ORGANISM="Pyramimonas sp., Strain CCMP2087" /LENGTH=308 /DNA_ID=CAMNT_0043909399 /DNA_START=52 /DNA_END=978 /DNA_ORIENTATION=-